MSEPAPRTLKPPFPYYGAKQHIASWVARHLPSHEHYVEPFAGSLAVLLAKARSPQETINDLDEELMAFWRILRERPDELERACLLTPHARAEFLGSLTRDGTDDLERARRVWVQLTQGRGASTLITKRGWRNRHGPRTSLPRYLAAYAGRIPQAAERLAGVSLECRPAEELIEAYGRCPSVCLYVDPPYLATTRSSVGYRHELGDGPGHERLAEALHATRCSVVLSGYPSALYDRLYAGWSRVQCSSQTVRGGVVKESTEVLWIKKSRHRSANQRAQLTLFADSVETVPEEKGKAMKQIEASEGSTP